MSFWISFSNVLYFTRNARKTPLIPEGFVLETPPEHNPTPLQFKPESPTFRSTLPTIPQSPATSSASLVPETSLGPVILIGNDSTETLVDVVTQPVFPISILQLHPPAKEAQQTRRISFAVCATPPHPVRPVNVIDVGQVPSKPSAATAETHEQAEHFREDVPDTEKKTKRKSIVRSMSFLGPRTSRTKARRLSVPVFSSLADALSKRL
ncbi:hypothetical protein DEU56DRAFT_808356 [Suillus clintonianus]|uniref:uncharacterized protein n=1 Tax=Suillus clintonianus TaxID=1904413 RepID=UPI001B864F79|nr:uncharacterized protein DEU56DRAFT_808356 [Suillus clintonianus]KAG2135164.1 hypothetical protein DEU56DRAFT_808356 [Suillus clintonianus]